jgi:hypothetical protein
MNKQVIPVARTRQGVTGLRQGSESRHATAHAAPLSPAGETEGARTDGRSSACAYSSRSPAHRRESPSPARRDEVRPAVRSVRSGIIVVWARPTHKILERPRAHGAPQLLRRSASAPSTTEARIYYSAYISSPPPPPPFSSLPRRKSIARSPLLPPEPVSQPASGARRNARCTSVPSHRHQLCIARAAIVSAARASPQLFPPPSSSV